MQIKDLSNMGAAQVRLIVDAAGTPAIEKMPVSDVEYAFYLEAAPLLREAGVLSPDLIDADQAQRRLRIEYIPHPLSQDDAASAPVLSVLARLHRYTAQPGWRYHPHQWTTSALEQSLALLALPASAARTLRDIQRQSDALFVGRGLVCGDSNAGNWGIRDNGEWVLFDWERFGTGSPAIDLAPLVRAMGDADAYRHLAERYCEFAPNYHARELAREIALCKAWIVTEVVVLLHQRQKADYTRYLA